MMLSRPLVEWESVHLNSRVSRSGEAPRFFTITHDGRWTEADAGTGNVESGRLTWLELRIVDALVDQINRETVPTTPVDLPPDGDNITRDLVLDNGPSSQLLLEDLLGRASYYADDALDFLEIEALDAFVGYLDRKYVTDPGETIT